MKSATKSGPSANLRQSAGKWFVVKVGGELVLDAAKLSATLGRSIGAFLEAGVKVVVVHGAGPQASDLQKRLGIPVNQVGGRRVTDTATLEVMKMALAGRVSVDIAAALRSIQVPALCTSGVSAGLVDAVKETPRVVSGGPPEPVDFGWVGEISDVNVTLLEKLAQSGVVTVLASLAADSDGRVYNVNADTMAAKVASRLGAARLFLVSNVPGVLLDKNDPSTRISHLSREQARAHINSGTISGGMIPKVEDSLSMLDEGVDAIHIVGLDPPDSLLKEAQEPGSVGTVLIS
jgi:acetylglutamate kinase